MIKGGDYPYSIKQHSMSRWIPQDLRWFAMSKFLYPELLSACPFWGSDMEVAEQLSLMNSGVHVVSLFNFLLYLLY